SSARVAARIAAETRAWDVPVEKILSDHDVLLMGENHGSLTSVETLARQLPRLAAAGVTVVGVEGLKRPEQAAVDAYVSGRANAVPFSALDFSPRRIAAFANLFKAARDNGVRVVALGLPLEAWAEQAASLAAANTGRPERDFAGDATELMNRAQRGYVPGFNEAVAEVFLTRRNRTMAEFLTGALADGGKAVALVGQAHVAGLDMIPGRLMNAPGDWGTLPRELARRAVKAFSLTQTGGLFVDVAAATGDRLARPDSYARAAAASPRGAQAYVPLGPNAGLWHAGGRVGRAFARWR
ncbi:MAG: ChaN family lipoprotein, partial [Elusimicrobia bacterium]|nr:ChaN family lipoprotein [Elusimicrobiota bacterium]